MNHNLLHTPEGVRDIYGEEHARKLKLEELLHQKISSFGYQDIQTPTIEFFDVFSKEIGTTPSKELYKFFDKEGNTLVLRSDFTPSIARCAAKYFCEGDFPIRLSYLGNTFINSSNLQGKLKEVTQLGAELIGDDSIEADAEIIAMVIQCLLNTGLVDFQISVGEVDYFRGICEEAAVDTDTELALREYISEKNVFGIEDLLQTRKISASSGKALLKLPELFGGLEILADAKKLVSNKRSLESIKRLERLHSVLEEYGVDRYVSFELGMLSKYQYYTGIIFKAYTYGIGDAIVKGGRYNHLLKRFGKDEPAIGFMVVVDDLMTALSSQKIHVALTQKTCMIVYQEDSFQKALYQATKMRENGISVEMLKADKSKNEEAYQMLAQKKLYQNCLFI